MADVNLRAAAVSGRALAKTDVLVGATPGQANAGLAFKTDTVEEVIEFVFNNPPAGKSGNTNLTVENRDADSLDIASSTGDNATIPAASPTEAGLQSAADKSKLDGVTDDQTAAEVPVTATGFDGNLSGTDDNVQTALETLDGLSGVTNLTVENRDADSLDIASSTGDNATIPAASPTEAGLQSAADKSKLDGVTDDQTAAEVPVTATGFDGNLSGTDDNVQTALETLDGLSAAGGAGVTNLTVENRDADSLDIASSTGDNATIPAASPTEAGLQSAADKSKLDGVTDDQTAAEVPVTATGFDGNLSGTDDNVQTALETLDGLSAAGGAGVVTELLDERADATLTKIGELASSNPTTSASVRLVADSTETVAPPDLLQIDDEIVMIVGLTSQAEFSVRRAMIGSAASAHLAGAPVYLYERVAGRTLKEATWGYHSVTNQNVFSFGLVLGEEHRGKTLHGEYNYWAREERLYGNFSFRAGILMETLRRQNTLDSGIGNAIILGNFPRVDQADLVNSTQATLLGRLQILTAAHETAGLGTKGDNGLRLAIRALPRKQPAKRFQLYMYLKS